MKLLVLTVLVIGLVVYVTAEMFFNLNSNLVALAVRDSAQPLMVLSKRGDWKTIAGMTPGDLAAALIQRHAEQGMSWSTLRVRRDHGTMARLAQQMWGAEVHVVVISAQHFDFMTSYRPKFAVTTAAERLRTDKLWFAITANFRDPQGRPLGWVWHEGVQVNRAFPEWSGCFFVKGGVPYFGPKSLLDEVPGPVEEGTQGYPSVMKNHTVFPYVSLKPDAFFDGTKITYRALAGMRRDGTIVFVLSGDGGVMNINEVAELARKLDMQHATLLDGGRALQYSLLTEDGPWHFSAFNTQWDLKWHKLLEPQRSPVFIGVRRKAPPILGAPR